MTLQDASTLPDEASTVLDVNFVVRVKAVPTGGKDYWLESVSGPNYVGVDWDTYWRNGEEADPPADTGLVADICDTYHVDEDNTESLIALLTEAIAYLRKNR